MSHPPSKMMFQSTNSNHFQSTQSLIMEDNSYKGKFENLQQQFLKMKDTYENELSKMSSEINDLIAVLNSMELKKESELAKFRTEIKQSQESELLYRLENQALLLDQQRQVSEVLRQQLNDRQHQLEECQQRLSRVQRQDDDSLKALERENNELRKIIQNRDLEKQRELKSLSDQALKQQQQAVHKMQQLNHSTSLVQETELKQLKKLLDLKNTEIQNLIEQNQHMRGSFQLEIDSLNEEVQKMQETLILTEQRNRNQSQQLTIQKNQENLTTQNQIQTQFEQLIATLQTENQDLLARIAEREKELLECNAQKQSQREFYDEQLRRAQIEILQMEKEVTHQKDTTEQTVKILNQTKEQEFIGLQDLIEQLRSEVLFINGQLELHKGIVKDKNSELTSTTQKYILQMKLLEDKVSQLSLLNDQLQERLDLEEKKHELSINDQKYLHGKTEENLRKRIQDQEIQKEKLNVLNKESEQQISALTTNIQGLTELRAANEAEIQRLREQNLKLKEEATLLETQIYIRQQEMVKKFEKNSEFQAQQIRSAVTTQITLLEEENKHLKYLLEQKRRNP